MESRSRDFWVGLFVLLAFATGALFFGLMGSFAFVRSNPRYFLRFSFAGGVEIGSPVRVSGVKVGRVEKVDFLPSIEGPDRAAIEVTVSVAPKVLPVIHEDSRFFVNIAGIIGERYIEISPGSLESPVLPPESRVRAVDPPRIDQLLSQGYGVFGRIQDFLEQNEKTVTGFLNQLARLMNDTTKMLEKSDRQKIGKLIDDFTQITGDVRFMTEKLRGPQGAEFFDRLMGLVERANEIDKPALKKFLQEEGIRARMF